MKYGSARSVFLVVAALAVALLAVPGVVHAQSRIMRVKVPFDFYIGDTKFPAGRYEVWRNQGSLVHLSDANGHTAATFAIFGYRPSSGESGGLIFNRYGDSHFLAEVRWTDSAATSQFSKSSLERELAKNAAPEKVATTNNNR